MDARDCERDSDPLIDLDIDRLALCESDPKPEADWLTLWEVDWETDLNSLVDSSLLRDMLLECDRLIDSTRVPDMLTDPLCDRLCDRDWLKLARSETDLDCERDILIDRLRLAVMSSSRTPQITIS